MHRAIKSIIAGLLLSVPAWSHADVITQFNVDNAFRTGNFAGAVGQILTTPAGSSFDHLTFNLYTDLNGTTPLASGTAYILSQLYTGSPADLSASTPGFLANSIDTTGGLYYFAPGFTIQPGTTYYVYETDQLATFGYGETINDFVNILYTASSSTAGYTSTGINSSLFTLSGTAVPEPSTYACIGFAGLTTLAAARRRRRA